MQFEIGQEVKFKDAAGGGTVVRIQGDDIYVRDGFGFDTPYTAGQLLPSLMVTIEHVENKEAVKTKVSNVAAQQVDRLVIDLHSYELLESTHGMTRYEILSFQLDRAADTVREARRRRIERVLIIHGKGSGRLQQEVHDLLGRMGNLEYYFADFSEGGYGATEVRFMGFGH
jgi:dsDNA-specific endonuclease/ATPase MutS2